MSSHTKFPAFLDNSPCGKDLFESGSQKRTAKSIADHIRNNEGYRLIGLDGSWGAGKSNVISIIKEELSDAYHLFIYDAWSHQEDLQRRSFLEEFTADLSNAKIIDSTKWDLKLKDLLSKKKETITKTIPNISPAYYFILASITLLPFAHQVAETINKKYVFWKLILSAAPLLLLLMAWAIAAIFIKEYRNLNKILAIYKEKDLHKTVDETISERQPSVREFRNWMIELSEDLKKNVLVVFDNMDRLPPDKVQNLWSSIHTFFSEHRYSRIHVIVPFDRNHIRDAFKGDLEKSGHFISKTFPVIFNVAPAVLTDWWVFFEIKFKEAFSDSEEGEYEMVKNIFDRYQEAITPRKIITFMNELVSLKLMWKNEIRLRYMAVYLLNKDAILENPVKVILDKGYLEKVKLLFREEDNIDDNIAALVYNVPVSIASQVTLYRSTLNSIRDQNNGMLNKLVKHRDFYKILEEIFAKEHIDFAPSVDSLKLIDEITNSAKSKSVLSSIWNILASQQLLVPIDSQSFTDIHKTLLTKVSQENIKPLVSYIIQQFSNSRNFKGDTYFIALEDLSAFIHENKLAVNAKDFIKPLKLSPEAFIQFVDAAKEKFGNYKVFCNNIQLDEYLLSHASKNWEGTEILPFIKDKFSFPKLKNHIEGMIEAANITKEDLSTIFNIYKALCNEKPLPKKLSDQAINNLLTQATVHSPQYYELVAMRVGRADAFTNFGGISQTILDSMDENLIEEVTDRVEYYINYGNLLEKSVSWPKPLSNAVAKKITLEAVGTSRLNIVTTLPLFKKIVDSINVSEIELFTRLNSWGEFLKEKLDINNLPELVPDFSIYNTAIQVNNKLSAIIQKTSIDYIEAQEPQEWENAFQDESSYIFRLLNYLLKNQLLKGLPHNAMDAYKESLLSIANNSGQMPIADNSSWEEFYKNADKRQLKSTVKNVRDLWINKIDIDPKKFVFFETALRNNGGLEEKSGDVVRRILQPVEADDTCFNLILEHADFYQSILSKAGDEKLDFIKAVRKKIESDQPNNTLLAFERKISATVILSIQIKQARYFTDENSVDVTDLVKDLITKERILHFKVSNDLFGIDPHPGLQKKLEIDYTFDEKEYSESFLENEWVSLP